jgi:hypothetical protein
MNYGSSWGRLHRLVETELINEMFKYMKFFEEIKYCDNE